MFRFRCVPHFLAAGLLLLAAAAANAQAYTNIVVFGDSLSDTGNDATLSAGLYTVNAQVPGPATGYTNGRFTDGLDTSPAARNYTGVWVEQLAAMLPNKPAVKNSLAGGTDYAYGFATTSTGTSLFTYGPGNALAFNVNNMQTQLASYLATNPAITSKTLFVLWGGANDLLQANASNANTVVAQAIANEATILETLIGAGATDFLVVNLPPLGLTPLNNGSATTSVPANQLAAAYDAALAGALSQIPAAFPTKKLNLFQMDTYTLFNTIVGPPLFTGLANVTAESQANTAVNPDTYLFWDYLHPTTYGHHLLAATALNAIGTPVATTTTVTTSNSNANLNASVTLTASVASTSGIPMGTVTFYDGTTALGSSLVFGSSSPATTTYTTTKLAAGTHSITAQYAGVNGFVSSSSAVLPQTVTAPAFTITTNGTTTIPHGQSNVATINLNAVGGFTGTVTLACGSLPADFTCSIAPASITYPSAINNAEVVIGSFITSAQAAPAPIGNRRQTEAAVALLFFPGLGFFGLLGNRRRLAAVSTNRLFLLLTLFASLGAATALTGCGSGPNQTAAPTGNYTIPINYTVNGAASTVNLNVTVQ